MERVKNTRVRWLRDIGNLLGVALLSGRVYAGEKPVDHKGQEFT
jgi:hypothetical protein